MPVTRLSPEEYLNERIKILETQISEIDAEISKRTADHEFIRGSLERARVKYTSSLYDEFALQELSLGKDYTERKQRMHQIIRGVNTGIFDEIRVFSSFLKSLNAERRQIHRELSVLKLRAQLLDEK